MPNERRDALGRVLCCHGRPMLCNECGDDYAAELNSTAALTAVPLPEWRCFHCDEVFTDRAEAEQHFGYEAGMGQSVPVCLLTKDEIAELRALEAENLELRGENERLENFQRLWEGAEADRVRRIGHREWWQELDYRDGEKIVLQERIAELERRLREAQAVPSSPCPFSCRAKWPDRPQNWCYACVPSSEKEQL